MMIKKIVALCCVTTTMLSQAVFATNDTLLISQYGQSQAKTEFYEKYGAEKTADVFYNGEYIEFDDVFPLAFSGTTFVPIRKFCDTIGAEIDYISETGLVVISSGDDAISFIPGSADINVNDTVVTLSTETFATDNRTMVPLRLISEVFGLEVVWNQGHSQVSIMDINQITDVLSYQYTIINGILDLSSAIEIQENLQVSGDVTIDAGTSNETVQMQVDFSSLMNKDMSLVEFDAQVKSEGIDTSNVILNNIFKDFDVNFILDLDKLDFYITSSIFEQYGDLFTGENLPEGTYLKVDLTEDMTDAEKAEYEEFLNLYSNITFQDIADLYIENLIYESSYVNLFENNLYLRARYFAQILNDESFIKNNNTFTSQGTFNEGQLSVNYKISAVVEDDIVTSYTISFDVVDAQYDISVDLYLEQSDAENISFSASTKELDSYNGTYDILSVVVNINRSESSTAPNSVPTGDIIEIN